MKVRLLKVMLAIIVMISFTGCSDMVKNKELENKLSRKEKIEDFEQMYETVKEGYPFIQVNKRLNKIDWDEMGDKYLERIKNTRNDDEFVREMSLILRDLNNGHTQIIGDENHYKFLKSIYTNSGYHFFNDKNVVERYKKIGSALYDSDSVKQNEEVVLQDVVSNKIGYMYLPKMETDKELREKDMQNIKTYIDTLENHQGLIIDIRGNTGGNDLYWRSIVSMLSKENIKVKGYNLFRNNETIKEYVSKRAIKTKEIASLPQKIAENAPSEVPQMFDSFVENTTEIYSMGEPKFKGSIYLLVDESVFSSSESFAIFCKTSKFATVIGKKTGGDGGGIDPVLFKLENSGLLVSMSAEMYLDEDGVCNEEFKTKPDYIIDNASKGSDFANDYCIQKVIELENNKK